MARDNKHLNPNAVFIIFTILLTAVIAVGRYSYDIGQQPSPLETQKTSPTAENLDGDQLDPVEARMRLMFFGDVIPARGVDVWAQASPLKYKYPFSKLDTFEREKYDAWIADLDCPITDKALSFEIQKTQLVFNCPPAYFDEAAKWFDVFSLATNHTYDQQEVNGFNKTRQNLQERGIQYFGNYENSYTDDICEVITLPTRFFNAKGVQIEGDVKAGLPVAFCGYHNVFRQATAEELAEIKRYAPYLPTVAMPHMGAEYEPAADSLKTAQYRQMVDMGADAVIGNHPHWVQNTEAYQGVLIAYSLGNFIFDQTFEPDVMRSVGIDANISIKYDGNLAEWQQLASKCEKFKDSCLMEAKSMGLKKPEFTIEYSLVPVDGSDRLTQKGGQQLLKQLLRRTNWEATLKALGR